jgi:anti-sigma factor RsiW
MSMDAQASSIFDPTGCPGQEKLLAYLGGQLDEKEAHEVEAHAASCDFCADALEGLAAVAHKEQIPVIVKQIHNQLRRDIQAHREKKRKRKMYVWLSALIVVVLVILLVAFFALFYSMKRQREQPAPPPAPQAAPASPGRASAHRYPADRR